MFDQFWFVIRSCSPLWQRGDHGYGGSTELALALTYSYFDGGDWAEKTPNPREKLNNKQK